MYYFLFSLLGILVGVGIGWMIKSKNLSVPRLRPGHLPSSAPTQRRESGEKDGLINPEQVRKHKENLEQIMRHLITKGQITNDEVQELLGVSNATAERYLDELESQGKIEQVGATGQSVYYKLRD